MAKPSTIDLRKVIGICTIILTFLGCQIFCWSGPQMSDPILQNWTITEYVWKFGADQPKDLRD